VGRREEVHPKHIRGPGEREAKVEGRNGGREIERQEIIRINCTTMDCRRKRGSEWWCQGVDEVGSRRKEARMGWDAGRRGVEAWTSPQLK
jgi:hypothetical protein